jgi:hypothetical protein
MRAPFSTTTAEHRNRVVATAVAGVVGLGAVMAAVARPMRAGGHDIVALEVAGDAETVDRIVLDWGRSGVRAAQTQTWMDMAWLGLYGVSTSAGCAVVAAAARRNGRDRVGLAGELLGWATVVAAACDAVENASMLAELSGARGPLPRLARRCALVKFALIGPAVAYSVGGLAVLGGAGVQARGAPSPLLATLPDPWAVPLGRALGPGLAPPFDRPLLGRR